MMKVETGKDAAGIAMGKLRRFYKSQTCPESRGRFLPPLARGVLLRKQGDEEERRFPGRLEQSRYGAKYSATLVPLAAL